MNRIDLKDKGTSTRGTYPIPEVQKMRLRRLFSGEPPTFVDPNKTPLKRDTASAQEVDLGAASIDLMSKATAALEKYSDHILFNNSVGKTGRYILKDSGIPLVMIYDYIVEGFSNEEIASMVDGLSADEVAMVHDFIDSLL